MKVQDKADKRGNEKTTSKNGLVCHFVHSREWQTGKKDGGS